MVAGRWVLTQGPLYLIRLSRQDHPRVVMAHNWLVDKTALFLFTALCVFLHCVCVFVPKNPNVHPMKPFFFVASLLGLVLLAVLFWSSSGTVTETTKLPPVSILLGSIGTLLLLRGRTAP